MTQNTTVVPQSANYSRQPTLLNRASGTVGGHPWLLATILVGGSYAAVLATLYGLAYQCTHACPWAHWKSELSLKQLQQSTSQATALELFTAINRAYVHTHGQGDFLTPLVCFVNALEREMRWHTYFLSVDAWLETYRLNAVLPEHKIMRVQIAQQHERLRLLRYLLVSWLSSYTSNGDAHDALPSI